MTHGKSIFDLSGRVALVTGAGRGLGFEMARAMAAAGATVILNGRQEDTLTRAAGAIGAEGGAAFSLAFDVSDAPAVEKAIGDIRARHGRLDILINNVGRRDRRTLFDFALV